MSDDDLLERYGSQYHQWRTLEHNDERLYIRPIGLVESFFDVDGTHYEGRADINALITLKCNTSLSPQQVRDWITLRWAALGAHHSLLRAKVVDAEDVEKRVELDLKKHRCLIVDHPHSLENLLAKAKSNMVFLGDHYASVDAEDFYRHGMNCARTIDPSKVLSKLFVFPLERDSDGKCTLRLLLVAAHQITDGLTIYSWTSHMLSLLNQPQSTVTADIHRQLDTKDAIFNQLPAAQEDLYPAVRGNKARQRWFWAISRILRHVRRPPPAGFRNPLRRSTPLAHARPMPPTYSAVLDYTRTPPLNSLVASATLSPHATTQLTRLCRSVNASIGAGCFALVALSLMTLADAPHRDSPSPPAPFVCGFPLNPRPFLAPPPPAAADSMMLWFADGLTLPFLPPALPLLPRLRLLTRQAHRQLAVYQKRPRSPAAQALLASRGPDRLAPAAYLSALERADARRPPGLRRAVAPQGAYPVRTAHGPATCGVSSVGSRTAWVKAGRYKLELDAGRVFAADFRDLRACVRARDDEFLVGSAGDPPYSMHFDVSYDGNALDEVLVKRWVGVMEGLLEGVAGGGEAKL